MNYSTILTSNDTIIVLPENLTLLKLRDDKKLQLINSNL